MFPGISYLITWIWIEDGQRVWCWHSVKVFWLFYWIYSHGSNPNHVFIHNKIWDFLWEKENIWWKSTLLTGKFKKIRKSILLVRAPMPLSPREWYQAISARGPRDYFSRSKSPAGTVLLLLNTTILTFLCTIWGLIWEPSYRPSGRYGMRGPIWGLIWHERADMGADMRILISALGPIWHERADMGADMSWLEAFKCLIPLFNVKSLGN